MRIHGTIEREGRWHAVAIPALGVYTQGRTHVDALRMAKDAVELTVDRSGVRVIAEDAPGGLTVRTDPPAAIVGLLLRRRRQEAGLSLPEVARRLGQRSPNAYARYEQGGSMPTIEKLDKLLTALDPHRGLVLSV